MKNLLIILISSTLFTVSCSSQSEDKNKSAFSNSISRTDSVSRLPNNQVCMVNDKFMNKDQTPVPGSGKTYYGCCQGCVSTLKNDTASRFASDPTTGESVDKAEAFIIIKPGSKDEVLYFKSETNAKKYLKK